MSHDYARLTSLHTITTKQLLTLSRTQLKADQSETEDTGKDEIALIDTKVALIDTKEQLWQERRKNAKLVCQVERLKVTIAELESRTGRKQGGVSRHC